jgi:hypothetical protein
LEKRKKISALLFLRVALNPVFSEIALAIASGVVFDGSQVTSAVPVLLISGAVRDAIDGLRGQLHGGLAAHARHAFDRQDAHLVCVRLGDLRGRVDLDACRPHRAQVGVHR